MNSPDFIQPDHFEFTEENLKQAHHHISKYPDGKQASACMPLLDLAQRQHDGWLPRVAMDYVADLLDMPRVKVYEVATFYTMYNKEPVGKHHIQVCTNISCWLRGSDQIMAAIKETAELQNGETSPDRLLTLNEVECLGACTNGPMMQINDDYYEDLTPENAKQIVLDLQNGRIPKTGPFNGRICAAPNGGPTTLTGESDAD
jgi:NADH dehydrogenase (ubiquinone) flavoprotein 2